MSDAGATPPAPRTVAEVFARKAALEAAMAANPDDPAPRAAYFELLGQIANSNSGLLWANLPELEAPLALRAGTPDLRALTRVFQDKALDIALPCAPRRILLIGAYAGYTAVDLARRYPAAEIAAAEPLPDNLRLLRLNTLAWPRIAVLPEAAWHSTALIGPSVRFQADWWVRLSDEGPDEFRVLPARPVPDLLALAGWDHADLIVCDCCGGEIEIFTGHNQAWLGELDAALVVQYPNSNPPAAPTLDSAFPEEVFERRQAGGYQVFTRRAPRTTGPARPAPLSLLRTGPGLKPFRLGGVPETGWGFFIFDGASCQLHPSGIDGQPSRAMFPVQEAGHVRFVSGILHAGLPGAFGVVFTAFVVGAGGTIAAQTSATLVSQQTGRLSLEIPPLPAPYHIVLQTTMASGAQNHRLAWARWLHPRLL